MTEDLEYLSTQLEKYARTDQLVVNCKEKLYRLEREDYYPDENGYVGMHIMGRWVDNTFSVYELQEVIKQYGEQITELLFEVDGEKYDFISASEISDYANMTYLCVLNVGHKGDLLQKGPEDFTIP